MTDSVFVVFEWFDQETYTVFFCVDAFSGVRIQLSGEFVSNLFGKF
jgi:hypothetical protein